MADSKIKAQVSLEFTISFVCLLIFLLATTKIFVWLGDNIIKRHKAYEDTRTDAGKEGTTLAEMYFYTSSKLDIFGK